MLAQWGRERRRMKMVSVRLCVLAVCLGSITLYAQGPTPPSGAFKPELPATYTGTWPCADCPGILYQLNLFPDHTFASRMTYQERSTHADEHGTWEIADDGRTLVLHAQHGSREEYAVPDSETLRKLDVNGHEIQSSLNYDLKRATKFKAIGGAVRKAR
jgi:copper homeostasis protein (lipoprotein)